MSNKMKLVVYLILVLFNFSVTTANVYTDGIPFVPLLSQIRSMYATSAIFFVQPKNIDWEYDAVFASHLIHTWCRLLGRNEIFTLVVRIDEMHALAKYYNSIVSPLIVVLILGKVMFHDFSEKTKSFKMSFGSWFVIFIPSMFNDTHEYCYRPPGNPFHLSFGSKMMVICEEDFTLREWYSVDGKSTEIFELARWYPEEGSPNIAKLDMFTNLSLYDRRKDMRGTVLRGVVVKNSMMYRIVNGIPYGYFSTIISELQNSLNFSIDIVKFVDSYGSFNANNSTNNWSGAMGYVTAGIVDIGVSDFSMTNIRLDYVDFTIPLIISRTHLNLKQSNYFDVNWFAYCKTFSVTVWICVLVTVIIAHFVLSFIRSHIESGCLKKLIYDEFMRIWSIICQQGISETSQRSSLRLAYWNMSIFAMVISAAYSGMLICFLTSQFRQEPIRTMEEFIRDGSYSMLVMENSSDYDIFALSNDSMSVALLKLMKPNASLPIDMESGYKHVCERKKTAFYNSFSSQIKLRSKLIDFHIPCETFMIDFGRVDNMCMILTKNNQFTALLNYHLQILLSSGVLNRYKKDIHNEKNRNIEPVGFNSIVSGLMIFFFGVSMAFIILIVEMCYYMSKSIQNPNRFSY